MTTAPPRRQRGTTLLEALIAFLVLSLGMLAVARAQMHLRLNAEVARQRSEAVRLAQEDIEALRAFAVLATGAGARSFESIASDVRTIDARSGYATNTAYQLAREVLAAGPLQAKAVQVSVSWADQRGNAQQIALGSVIAGIAPAYSGALGLTRDLAPTKGLFGRAVRIPTAAKDLGDGRSALKPAENGTVALVFDNASGLLTGYCAGVAPATATSELTIANLGFCEERFGYLLSGTVRFSSAIPPDAARPNDLPPAFTVAMEMSGG